MVERIQLDNVEAAVVICDSLDPRRVFLCLPEEGYRPFEGALDADSVGPRELLEKVVNEQLDFDPADDGFVDDVDRVTLDQVKSVILGSLVPFRNYLCMDEADEGKTASLSIYFEASLPHGVFTTLANRLQMKYEKLSPTSETEVLNLQTLVQEKEMGARFHAVTMKDWWSRRGYPNVASKLVQSPNLRAEPYGEVMRTWEQYRLVFDFAKLGEEQTV